MPRKLSQSLLGLFSLVVFLLPVLVPVFLVRTFGTPAPASPVQPPRVVDVAADGPRPGDVQILPGFEVMPHATVRSQLRPYEPAARVVLFGSMLPGEKMFAAAPALDGTLSVPHGFLLEWVPYQVSQAWMPLYAVADHLRYQLDQDQFFGRGEVWLSTMQAWTRARGDCEDHAMLLADWLIDMGFDARVALGKHAKEGHAWVVVFKDGKEYLLEATLKQKLKRWSAYPLARMLPDYHPEMMFNREMLWVNTGSPLTVSYAGAQWRQAVRFLPAKVL